MNEHVDRSRSIIEIVALMHKKPMSEHPRSIQHDINVEKERLVKFYEHKQQHELAGLEKR